MQDRFSYRRTDSVRQFMVLRVLISNKPLARFNRAVAVGPNPLSSRAFK